MMKQTIAAVYRRTADRHIGLGFAADLATRLGVTNLTIFLKLQHSLTALVGDAETVQAKQQDRVLADVTAVTRFHGSIELAYELTPGTLVVDRHLALTRDDLDCISPQLETSLLARGNGPLLIPFGDGWSAVHAASVALSMAKMLDLPVIFYHTSYRDARIESEDTQDHMCEGAVRTQRRLLELAAEFGVEHKLVTEMAADVFEGILQCAMREGARLIVIPRSKKTTVGCYAERALKDSPIPTLALAARDWRPL